MAWSLAAAAGLAGSVYAQGDPPAPAPAGDPAPAPPVEAWIRFNFIEAPFAEVLNFFARQTGLPVIREAEPPAGGMTFISAADYSLEEALEILNLNLRMHSLRLEREDRYLYLRSLEDAARRPTPVVGADDLAGVDPSEFLTVYIPLNNAIASQVAERITPLVKAPGMVQAFDSQNMLIVVETAAQCRRIREIVAQIDAVRPADIDFRVFPVRHSEPSQLAQTLRTLIPERDQVMQLDKNDMPQIVDDVSKPPLRIQADERLRAVVVVGPGQRMAAVEELVALLDSGDGAGGARQLMAFTLPGADPVEAARQIQGIFKDEPANRQPRVQALPEVGKLIVLAPADVLAQTRRVLEEIDPGLGGPDAGDAVRAARVIGLTRMDAGQADQIARRVLTPRQLAVLRFAPAPTGGGVVVAGPASDVAALESLLRELDGAPDRDREARLVRLAGGDPAQVVAMAESLEKLTGDAERDPVRAILDEGARTVTLVGSAQGVARYERLLRSIEAQATSDLETRTYRLDHARASELSGRLSRMARLVLEPGDGGVYRAPEFEAFDELDSLVVRARPEQHETIAGLVGQLDTPALGADVELRTYRVRRADPGALERAVRDLAARGALAPAGRPGVTTSVEPVSRTLLVWGPGEAFEKIESLIRELDGDAGLPATRLQLYTLEHARADRLAPLLSRLLETRLREQLAGGGVPTRGERLLEVEADHASNTLIISAPESIHEIARQLIDALDTEAASVGRAVIRVIPLTYAEAAQVAQTVNQALPGLELPTGGVVRVVAAAGSNALLLTGAEADLKKVEELVEPLDRQAFDPEKPSIETFPLRHADAAVIAPTVERLLVDQQQTDPRVLALRLRYNRGVWPEEPKIRVESERRTNSLIVSGPSSTIELARSVIERLDQPAEVADRTVEVFTPAKGDPAVLAQSVARIVRETMPQGRRPLEITPEPATGCVVVIGEAAQVAEALRLLARRDDLTVAMPLAEVRSFDLEHADVGAVSRILQQVLSDRSRWPEELERARRAGAPIPNPGLFPDAGTSRLYVSAASALMPLAAELVEALDKPAPAAAVEVRVFRLKEGDAASVAQSLTDAVSLGLRPGEPRPTIRAEASSNSVVVAASRERLETAAGLIESMDAVAVEPGGMGVRTIFLTHARAETLAPIVERVLTKETIFSVAPEWGRWQLAWNMSNRGETPEFAGVKVAAEPRLNALIVSAPVPMLELAEELVSGLDVDPGDGPGGERTMRVITLLNADARELAANVEALFADAATTSPAPTVRVDSSSNSLIVRGTGEQLELIDSLAAHLDRATLATRSQVRMIPLNRARVDAAEMARTLKTLLEQRGGVRVEVITADELLSAPGGGEADDGAQPDGEPSSSATPAGLAPLMGAVVRAAVAMLNVQPAAGVGATGEEPTVTIAVDPATNTLMIVGSPRLTERIAALAAELERQMPTEPTGVRLVELPESVNAAGVAQIITQTVWQVGQASAQNPGGFTGRVTVAGDPDGRALIVWANETDFASVRELIAGLSRLDKADELEVKVFPLANVTGRSALAAVRDLVSPAPQGRQARRVRTLEISVVGEDGEPVRRVIDPQRVSVTMDPNETSLIVTAPAASMPLIDRFVSLIDQTPDRDRLAIRQYGLENAEARALSGTLQTLFDAQRQGASAREQTRARFVADDRTNSLFVTASSEQHEEIGRLLEVADVSLADAGLELAIIPLQLARPSAVQQIVRDVVVGKDPAKAEKVLISAQDTTGVFVVRAPAEELAQIREIVSQVDTAETAAFPVRAIRLERADARNVATSLQEFFRERMRLSAARGSRQGGGAAIIGDRRSGTLVIAASDDDYEQLAELARQFDAPAEARELQYKVIQLQNARVADVRDTVQNIAYELQWERSSWFRGAEGTDEDRLLVEVNDRTNTVLLFGQGEAMTVMERIVAELDRAPAEQGARIVRAIRAEGADLDALARIIEETTATPNWRWWMGPDPDAVAVEVDRDRRLLILIGPRPKVEEAVGQVEEIAAATGDLEQIETVQLENARASEVARELERALPESVRVRVTAAPRTNSIMLTGSERDLAIAREQIALLDVGTPRPPVEFRKFPLEHATAYDVALSIRALVRNRPRAEGEPAPVLDPSPSDDVLWVTATADEMGFIESVIGQLDQPQRSERTTEFIKLEFAQAEQVRKALGVFYGPYAQEANTPAERNVTIVADPASNSLVVSAGADIWEGLRELLAKLDTPDYDTTQQLVVIQLEHASAVSVARALNEGFRAPLENQLDRERVRLEAERRRSDGREEPLSPTVLVDAEGVPTVSAERETNSLIVFAGRQELERIREIVRQLDVPDILKLPEARLIALKSGRASTLAEAVRRVFLAQDNPENPRRVLIYGDDASNVIIVRAEDAEFEQIEALAQRLQAQAATAEALPRVIPLRNTPAARMRDTILQTFEPIARQRGEAFTVQIDRGTNSIVVAASETLHEQISGIVEQLDGAAAPGEGAEGRTGGIGQNVTIVELEHNAPSDVVRHLEALGVTQPQPADRPGLVSEPVRLVALTTRRGISVLANPADARIIERLVRELDREPGLADEHVKIVRLRTAQAAALATLLQQMLTPSPDAERSGAAEGLVEQVRRLNLVNGGMDEAAVRLDLSRPIRVIADAQSNSVIVSSSIGNAMAVAELIKSFDAIPIGEEVTLRVFPLENASAARVRAIVEDLFRRGEELQRIPGTQGRGMPPTTVGRALVGPIVVTADERTNAIVVAGPEEAVALVEVLLKDLDDGDMERGWIETSVIQLQFADAVTLAQKLRTVLVEGMGDTPEAVGLRTQVGRLRVALAGGAGAVTGDRFARMDSLVIEAEENLNALIVLGTDGNIAIIRELVKLMDVEQAAASNTVRVIPLEHAAAERVAGIISDVFSQRQGVRSQRPEDRVIVSVDARTNALIVSTSPRSFAILQGLLRTLDTAEARFAVGLHVIPVVGSDVERLAPKIQRLMRERIDASRQRGGRESPLDAFQVEAEPATNSLIVACSDENLELVNELIAALTTGDVEVAGAERTALISVRTPGLAPDIARTINDLYVVKENQKRGERSVGVVANERMNALIASGTEEDIAAIRGLVAQLDQAPVELLQDVRRVRLDSAGAREIVELVESVLAGRPIGGGRGGPSATRIRIFQEQLAEVAAEATIDGTLREHVTLTPDPRTNSVLIKAPPELMELIVTMIEDLDAETRGDRVIEQFRLINADAGQMQQLLVQLFNLQQNGDRYVLAPTGAEPADEFESGTFTPISDERQELSITIDRRTNTLLVSGTREYLEEVRKVVVELDSIEATERERLVYHLRNTKAVDIAETLQSYFSGERELRRSTLGPQLTGSLARELEQEVTVVGDERSNKLVISASPRYIETVAQIVEELDAAPPQVMIQVLLAEVTLDDAKEFGVDVTIGGVLQEGESIGDLTERSNIGGDGYALQKLAAGAAVATALGVPNFAIASADFGLLIRALQEQGKLEVLSRPQVQVNDNERAFIQVGENIGITDGVEQRDTGGSTAIVRREDVGIILEVVPSISADGFVRMEITPEISTLSDRTTEISENFAAPIITQRRVETTVTVRDGQTVVIGGLMQSTDQLRKTKVPLLGDIPLLGALFRSSKQSSVKTELLVILTPYVIPGGAAGDRQDRLTEHALDMLEDPTKIRDVLEREHKIPMDAGDDQTGFGDVMRLIPAPAGSDSWKERLKGNGSIGNSDSPR